MSIKTVILPNQFVLVSTGQGRVFNPPRQLFLSPNLSLDLVHKRSLVLSKQFRGFERNSKFSNKRKANNSYILSITIQTSLTNQIYIGFK